MIPSYLIFAQNNSYIYIFICFYLILYVMKKIKKNEKKAKMKNLGLLPWSLNRGHLSSQPKWKGTWKKRKIKLKIKDHLKTYLALLHASHVALTSYSCDQYLYFIPYSPPRRPHLSVSLSTLISLTNHHQHLTLIPIISISTFIITIRATTTANTSPSLSTASAGSTIKNMRRISINRSCGATQEAI